MFITPIQENNTLSEIGVWEPRSGPGMLGVNRNGTEKACFAKLGGPASFGKGVILMHLGEGECFCVKQFPLTNWRFNSATVHFSGQTCLIFGILALWKAGGRGGGPKLAEWCRRRPEPSNSQKQVQTNFSLQRAHAQEALNRKDAQQVVGSSRRFLGVVKNIANSLVAKLTSVFVMLSTAYARDLYAIHHTPSCGPSARHRQGVSKCDAC